MVQKFLLDSNFIPVSVRKIVHIRFIYCSWFYSIRSCSHLRLNFIQRSQHIPSWGNPIQARDERDYPRCYYSEITIEQIKLKLSKLAQNHIAPVSKKKTRLEFYVYKTFNQKSIDFMLDQSPKFFNKQIYLFENFDTFFKMYIWVLQHRIRIISYLNLLLTRCNE